MIYIKRGILKLIMKINNVNQVQLAKGIGVDQAVISRILNGKQKTVSSKVVNGLLKYSGLNF
jgi:predicted XRE-type DNA-binding protein